MGEDNDDDLDSILDDPRLSELDRYRIRKGIEYSQYLMESQRRILEKEEERSFNININERFECLGKAIFICSCALAIGYGGYVLFSQGNLDREKRYASEDIRSEIKEVFVKDYK